MLPARFRFRLAMLAVLALLSAAPGCLDFKLGDEQVETTTPAYDPPPATSNGDYWQIKPVAMRIYPSSRFVVQNRDAVLEARVEFFDEAGDSTKAVGDLRIELFRVERTGEAQTMYRLYEWEVPVRTLKQNREHYDPITRAYLFRLRLDNPRVAAQPVRLQATFTPPRGNRLEAHTLLNAN